MSIQLSIVNIEAQEKILQFRNRDDGVQEVVFKCYHLRKQRLSPELQRKRAKGE